MNWTRLLDEVLNDFLAIGFARDIRQRGVSQVLLPDHPANCRFDESVTSRVLHAKSRRLTPSAAATSSFAPQQITLVNCKLLESGSDFSASGVSPRP